MTTKDKYIQKLEELIELWHFYADEIDAEDYRKIKRLESEISSLKAEMEKEEKLNNPDFPPYKPHLY